MDRGQFVTLEVERAQEGKIPRKGCQSFPHSYGQIMNANERGETPRINSLSAQRSRRISSAWLASRVS